MSQSHSVSGFLGTKVGQAVVVAVSLLVSASPVMAQNQAFEIPPGDGIDFFQMNWFYPGGPPILNSDWGRAVADPRRISEITGLPSCYLNVVTEDGWVIQNWFVDSSETLTLDGGLPPQKGFLVDDPEYSTYFDLGQDGEFITNINAHSQCMANPIIDIELVSLDLQGAPVLFDDADPSGRGEDNVASPGAAPPYVGTDGRGSELPRL